MTGGIEEEVRAARLAILNARIAAALRYCARYPDDVAYRIALDARTEERERFLSAVGARLLSRAGDGAGEK